jgi:hypothetical protein
MDIGDGTTLSISTDEDEPGYLAGTTRSGSPSGGFDS